MRALVFCLAVIGSDAAAVTFDHRVVYEGVIDSSRVHCDAGCSEDQTIFGASGEADSLRGMSYVIDIRQSIPLHVSTRISTSHSEVSIRSDAAELAVTVNGVTFDFEGAGHAGSSYLAGPYYSGESYSVYGFILDRPRSAGPNICRFQSGVWRYDVVDGPWNLYPLTPGTTRVGALSPYELPIDVTICEDGVEMNFESGAPTAITFINPVPVPLPASGPLLLAACGLAFWRRRKDPAASA